MWPSCKYGLILHSIGQVGDPGILKPITEPRNIIPLRAILDYFQQSFENCSIFWLDTFMQVNKVLVKLDLTTVLSN